MAGLLEPLEPLADLVALTDDPLATCAALMDAVVGGDITAMLRRLGAGDLVLPALRYAGVIGTDGRLSPTARDQLLRLEVLVASATADTDRWAPVMTVPAYLRMALPEGRVAETLPALLDLVSGARRRIVMASPFLDPGFESLIPSVDRFVTSGGRFMLITRELIKPDSHNAKLVRQLRMQCGTGGNLEVVSWEEEGLGLHLKAAVADSRRAYVGSANFTRGGMGQHAELGVRLEGPSVAGIEHLLDTLAEELRGRRRLRAR
jgi:phosphatidylserine/phosphatidylglycerophosphate/cardiolipin synthase-like enzyme